MDKYMKLIIQMPCYNEAETLNIALDALPRKLEGIDCIEYLIINDGSRDATLQAARQWGVNYIVNFKQNKRPCERLYGWDRWMSQQRGRYYREYRC